MRAVQARQRDPHKTWRVTNLDSELDNLSERAGFTDPRARLVYAGLYTAGLGLTIGGSVGSLLWSQLLWCAGAGLALIAIAFAVRAGRF